MIAADSLYKGFRFPEEIISHAVWLYYRFLLSLRDVQELLLERGVVRRPQQNPTPTLAPTPNWFADLLIDRRAATAAATRKPSAHTM